MKRFVGVLVISILAVLAHAQSISPTQVKPGTFQNGTYTFPGSLAVGATVFATPDKSLPAWAASLPAGGGKIYLGQGTYPRDETPITKRNVHFIGLGPAAYASDNTHFLSGTGTIVQGRLWINASGITVSGLSVDGGSTSGSCSDGLVITPGEGGAALHDVTVEHVSTLLCSATSPYHSVLVENVDGAKVSDITTRYGAYGLVLKSKHVKASHIVSSGHGTYCGIIKSDATYGVASDVDVDGWDCSALAAGDTGPINVDGYGAVVSRVKLSGIRTNGTSGGLYLDARTDGTHPGYVTDITLPDITADTATMPAFQVAPESSTSYVDRVSVGTVIANNIESDGVSIGTNSKNVTIDKVTATNVSAHAIDNAAEGTHVDIASCTNVGGNCVFGNQNHMTVTVVKGTATAGLVGKGSGEVNTLVVGNGYELGDTTASIYRLNSNPFLELVGGVHRIRGYGGGLNLTPDGTNTCYINNTSFNCNFANFNGASFSVGGTAGLNQTITVRNSAGTGTCTITLTWGLPTATTC